ncbi:MAG: multiheme c-type cytochrome [Thermodesulfobacteriota bacterium]
MRRKYVSFIAASLLAATLPGCGSSGGSGGNQTAGAGAGGAAVGAVSGVAAVLAGSSTVAAIGGAGATLATVTQTNAAQAITPIGADQCINCHQDFSWSAAEVAAYLAGPHVIHSTHISQSDKNDPAGCLNCHDPIGDGPTLEALINAANVPNDATDKGLAAVGCEACHGAGGQHYGTGPIPNATPDNTTCAACHETLPANHLTFHPEADNIGSKYAASPHASAPRNSAVCVKCHSDEGGRLYKDVTTVAQLETIVLPVAVASPVQCRTCHDPHNPSSLLKAATSSQSTEYRTCTNCHQAHDANVGTTKRTLAGSTSTDGASADGDLIYHATRWNRVITTTHWDDPATTTKIEGYTMSKTNARACRDCHDVHAADITINQQWAKSAHGGYILEAKLAAVAPNGDPNYRTIQDVINVKAAGVTETVGDPAWAPAWVHYDWDASNRQGCQRCHTATGLKNYLTDPTTYSAANNNFSHLTGWANNAGVITSSGQNEMLYCWGCHTDNAGGLRDPGAITTDYLTDDGSMLATFPDVNGSNVCLACHQGRESGGEIKADTGNFSNRSFINSHYLTAGGTLFQTTGFEFAGLNYDPPAFFAHDQIGMGTDADLAAWEATNGTPGPCIGCHMSSTEKHLFLPVEMTGGVISAITASVCVNCHDGGHGPAFVAKGGDAAAVAAAAAFLEAEKTELHAALEALEAQLAQRGYFFANSHPYFHIDTNANGFLDPGEINSANGVKNWISGIDATGKLNMGAAFNYNLLEHDPGSYAHNRYYTKRLIYDSLDFLDNGLFDGSVGNGIDTVAAANQVTHDGGTFTAAEAAEAKAYLDGDTNTAGVQRP